MRAYWAVAAFIAVGWASSSAAEAAPRVRLVYARDPGAEACPDERAVRNAVGARLGYDPFVDGPVESDGDPLAEQPRILRASIGAAGRWLRATIELTDETGELLGANQLAPHLRGCDALASAMELAIAIAIDPLHALVVEPAASPAPTPSPEPARTAAPPTARLRARPPRSPTSSSEEADDESRAHLVGRLAILGAVASAPSATWGFALGLGAEWRRFSVGAELRGDLPASRVVSGGTVSSSLVVVNLLPCVRAYGFFFCGLFSAGVLIGYGAEFAVDRRAVLPFVGGGARAGWELRLNKRLALGLQADLLAPFIRSVLEVDNQVMFRAPPVSGAFGVLLSGVLR